MMMHTRTLVIFALASAACASTGSRSTSSPESAAPAAVEQSEVIVEAPIDPTAEMLEKLETADEAVDECYARETLAGRAVTLPDFELHVRQSTGSTHVVVEEARSTQPEQELLQHCVVGALASIELNVNRGDAIRAVVPIKAPGR